MLEQSISDVTNADHAADSDDVTYQHERLVLSERDFARFVEVIGDPPAPTQKLRDAAAEYKRLRASSPKANW